MNRMALYAISDLHLPLGVHKPMDIFGSNWSNYVTRLKDNWCLSPEDTVVLGGDFSWATYLDESQADFEFINSLAGNKIFLKGNHDYWWTTMAKLEQFMLEHGYSQIRFLHNNAFLCGRTAVCGTKGTSQASHFADEQEEKLYLREASRFKLSLQCASRLDANEIVAFLHYLPAKGSLFFELMKEFGVKRCYYGHLHGETADFRREHFEDGIRLQLISCDYLGFQPIKISDESAKND